MRKHLGAFTLTCLAATPAMAQSNVTLYGVADVGIGYGKAGDTTFTGVVNGVLSGPRIGFKGSEDLGNGLKAVFQLEQGYSLGTGAPSSTSRQFHRQSWAGLKGGFGMIGLGRQYAPGYNFTSRLSAAVPGSVFNSQSILANSIPGASIHPNSDARWNNSIKYAFGGKSGIAAEAIYSFQDTQSGDDRTDDDKFGVGIGYFGGSFGAGVVYHRAKRTDENLDEIYLGGSVDLGAVTLFASYQTAKEGDVVDAAVAYLGASAKLGNGNIHLDVGKLSDDENDDNDSTSISVGYTHGLSKRTTLYAMVNRTTNDDNADRGVLAEEEGEGSTAVGFGMRHKF